MLPVNIAHEDETTGSLNSVAVKRQAIASTVYSSIGTAKYSVQYYLDIENKLFTIYYSNSNKRKTLVSVLYATI